MVLLLANASDGEILCQMLKFFCDSLFFLYFRQKLKSEVKYSIFLQKKIKKSKVK